MTVNAKFNVVITPTFIYSYIFSLSIFSLFDVIFLNETKISVFGSLKIFQINTKLSRRPKTCPSSPTRGNKPSDLKINSIKSSKVTSIISIKNSNRKCQSINKHGTSFQWIFKGI